MIHLVLALTLTQPARLRETSTKNQPNVHRVLQQVAAMALNLGCLLDIDLHPSKRHQGFLRVQYQRLCCGIHQHSFIHRFIRFLEDIQEDKVCEGAGQRFPHSERN